jgi:hypothetical protein
MSTNLGEVIAVLYEQFLAVYGDEELASVAVAATVNEMLADNAVASGKKRGRSVADQPAAA